MKDVALAIIGSGALATVVNIIFTAWRDRKKKEDGVSHGVRQLLYDRIKCLAKTYIARGYITSEELEDLITMHSIYHNDLNGNGYLDSLMCQVKSLPIKDGVF